MRFSISFLRSRMQAGTRTFYSAINYYKMNQDEVKMVMVSQKIEQEQEQEIDPLEEEILSMKLTANLLKEINFNSAVNKFDYFQALLSSENKKFNRKCNEAINNQRQLLKKVKTLQKTTKDIKNQTLPLNYPKLHVQLEELRTVKEEVNKYQKLSLGMIKYLEKIDEKLSSQ